MLDQSTKQIIKDELNKFVTHTGSANKAAVVLKVSGAVISFANNSPEKLSDAMWMKLAKNLGILLASKWHHANTKPAQKMEGYFNDAKEFGNVFGLVCTPGSGKTDMLDFYNRSQHNVFYVKCIRNMNNKELLQQLLTSMGVKGVYRTSFAMLEAIKRHTDAIKEPVIIWDEIEKGKNELFLLFIDLYNLLWKRCGIVLIGTHNLKERILTGNSRGYLGFNEVLSRLGGKLIEIPLPDSADAAMVVHANGITDPMVVSKIVNGSCENGVVDMRRIERMVHAEKQKAIAAAELPLEMEEAE